MFLKLCKLFITFFVNRDLVTKLNPEIISQIKKYK